jgi:cell division protein FtsQ
MKKSGLPVGPPPPELLDLPLQDEPRAEAPFLRSERRIRAKRPRRGPASRLLPIIQTVGLVLAGVLAVIFGARVLLTSEHLSVQRVEVRGNHFLSEGEVRELLGPAVGVSILKVDIGALTKRLLASPWVADATVARSLPNAIRVTVRERIPLALAELERLYLMDAEGDIIDIYGPRTGAFDLPIVRGLGGTTDDARRDRAQRAGALLADLGDLALEVSEVFVEPSGDLRVILKGGGEAILLGPPPCRQRLLTFLGIRRDLSEKVPDADYFDLRFRGRIYARVDDEAAPSAALLQPAQAPTEAAPGAAGR